jgi:DNA-3-methyladenine glycosylase I
VRYHDEEWGRPILEERPLYEKIVLEGFQAGLSWLTILRKRPAFRSAFAGFDPERIARFTSRDVERLLGDAGIVRHRGKIESTINNARRLLELRRSGSLTDLVWSHRPQRSAAPRSIAEVPAQAPESVALSRELRSRGWSFVGPTTVYAMMQAVGVVNDHVAGCWVRAECDSPRR